MVSVAAALAVAAGVSQGAARPGVTAEPLATGADWYPLQTDRTNKPGVIDMGDWLEAPAGKRGPVLMVGDRFETGGTPIKFWGVNLGGNDCLPSKDDAEYWADRFARYGINCVRLHKFFPELLSDEDSWIFKPEQLDRLDYFSAKLKERGIYFGWSPIYHLKIRPGDVGRLLAGEALLKLNNGNSYGIMDYAPDLQALRIGTIRRLLEHRIPYTGLTYAEEPALAFVEMQNEASIFFWTGTTLKKVPPYWEDLVKRFNGWLERRYGSQEKLQAAWGTAALTNEDGRLHELSRGEVLPEVDGSAYSAGSLRQRTAAGQRVRLQDSAMFMHEVQNAFYSRFESEVRQTGYRGPLVGSCWRAHGTATEYYNLRSDWLIGLIDRHNYHGGLSGWKPRAEAFNSSAQVNAPGGGLFSLAFQQLADRPFALSEWATVFPNEWALESPAIMAVYGLGLQDWDASYQFSARTSGRGFSSALHVGNLLWNVERPDQIGLYPALSRMVMRGDVAPGPVISTRRVSLEELERLEVKFGDEGISGRQDVKRYTGPMPPESFAAGRVVAEFVERPSPSDLPVREKLIRDGVIRSVTGELVWDVSRAGRGYFTVNTAASRGVVGFVPDAELPLGDLAIRTRGGFVGLFVTALDRDGDLTRSGWVLVTAMGRVRNTGMRYSPDGNTLESLGEAPILLEGVRAELRFSGRKIASVQVLDHDGRSTGRGVSHRSDGVELDTGRDRAFYYLLRLE
jgi:hypothetical protein